MINAILIKEAPKPLPIPAAECQVHVDLPWWHTPAHRLLVLIMPDGTKVAYWLDNCKLISVESMGRPS